MSKITAKSIRDAAAKAELKIDPIVSLRDGRYGTMPCGCAIGCTLAAKVGMSDALAMMQSGDDWNDIGEALGLNPCYVDGYYHGFANITRGPRDEVFDAGWYEGFWTSQELGFNEGCLPNWDVDFDWSNDEEEATP